MNCFTSANHLLTDEAEDTHPLPSGFWRVVAINGLVLLVLSISARLAIHADLQ